MVVNQSRFRSALLDAKVPVPDGLLDGTGAPAGRRYAVYRNNVTVSLIEAMKVAFPLVRSLLGNENFDTLVPMFVRLHPPTSPLMMHYGADFPEFLEGFQKLEHLGFLGDVARLDLAQRASYHAADAAPFDHNILQQPPEILATLHLARAPSTRLIRSRWPLFDLWLQATQPDAPKPRAISQAVLITRPAFDPEVHLLPPGAATWLNTLTTKPIGPSVDAAAAAAPDFDFAASLTIALKSSAFCTPEKDI